MITLLGDVQLVYHQQTKNLLASYSAKKPGFFQKHQQRYGKGA